MQKAANAPGDTHELEPVLESIKTLEQVDQRSCGCHLLPGSAQGQAGWSSEHPGLVEDVPAEGRGVGTR